MIVRVYNCEQQLIPSHMALTQLTVMLRADIDVSDLVAVLSKPYGFRVRVQVTQSLLQGVFHLLLSPFNDPALPLVDVHDYESVLFPRQISRGLHEVVDPAERSRTVLLNDLARAYLW